LITVSNGVDLTVFPNGKRTIPSLEDQSRWHGGLPMKNAAQTSVTTAGQFVRQRRLANHLTQRQLSELAGVGVRLVSELERGKATLRIDAVNRVLAVFGLMLGPVEVPRIDEGELWDVSEESN
jgi:y4mF family transcriptional regulator